MLQWYKRGAAYFCLSLYIMSISKYDHCYFEYFESIRDINIKNGVINA